MDFNKLHIKWEQRWKAQTFKTSSSVTLVDESISTIIKHDKNDLIFLPESFPSSNENFPNG